MDTPSTLLHVSWSMSSVYMYGVRQVEVTGVDGNKYTRPKLLGGAYLGH